MNMLCLKLLNHKQAITIIYACVDALISLMKISEVPTVPHCLQSFNQIVVIVFDTEEQEFDRISYLRGVYNGQRSDTAAGDCYDCSPEALTLHRGWLYGSQ